jgi:hypothetical protein
VVAVLAAAGGAVAAGAGGLFAGSADRQAILDKAAKRLGVTPQQLEDALRGATIDQIEAALAASRITKDQADALKQRIQAGDGLGAPFFGPDDGVHKLFGFLDSAGYLGLSEAQLRAKLTSGKTLAGIANKQGKSVDGLKQAIVDGAKKQLDQAVTDGKITAVERDEILSRLRSNVDDLVQGNFPHPPGLPDFGGSGEFHAFGFGFRSFDGFRAPRAISPSLPDTTSPTFGRFTQACLRLSRRGQGRDCRGGSPNRAYALIAPSGV